jgi:parallel beta-helix repeat protein
MSISKLAIPSINKEVKMAEVKTWKGLAILVSVALVLALGAVAVPIAGTVEAVVLPTEVWVNDDGPSCPDTGNGTQADPYCKIQTGINNVAPSGTVHVYPGKYNENLVINKSLTLQSVSGDWRDTIIDDIVYEPEITISGDADVTVQGFEITAGSYGIYIGKVFSTVNILDCFIHDNDFDGIFVAGGGDLLHIEGNIVSQNGYTSGGCGINITQAWNTTNIRDNIIGGWWDANEDTRYNGNADDGIRIDDVPYGRDVTIDQNLVVDNGEEGINLPTIFSVTGDVTIRDNVIGAWVYYDEVKGTEEFQGNQFNGIHVAHVTDTGNVTIESNAISENNEDGINFGAGVDAIWGTVTIIENIIGGWTCYPGDYGYSGDSQRYTGNYGEGIYIYRVGESGMVTIKGNKISENGYDTGIFINHIYGDVSIADNDIGAWEGSHWELYLGNAGDGIYIYWLYSGAVLTIGPDNSIKENTENGIEIYNSEFPDTTNITIHHNTIHNNSSNGIELGTPCQVDGATISHNIITNHSIGIYLTGSSDQNIISDNEIRNNADGIMVEGNDNQILHNNILNNQGGGGSGIHIISYHGYPTSGNVIHCNNIVGNLPYGVCYQIIYNDLHDGMYNQNGDEAVDATGNWWGCIEGPGAAGCDLVSGNVIYDPWLLDQFQYCEECGGAPRPPSAVPTVNHWGILAIIAVFAGLLVWRVRRRLSAS